MEYYIGRKISEQFMSRQIHNHKHELEKFDSILKGRDCCEIKHSVDVLKAGNEIFYKEKEFWKYDDESVLGRARERFTSIKNVIHGNIVSYIDIGCGAGENVAAASEYGIEYSLGVDIRDEWENHSWYGDDIGNKAFLKADITEHTLDEKFDLVTSYNSFEHFLEPQKMLDEMGDIVKTGGYLWIEFAPIWNCSDGHHMYRYVQFPYYHLIFDEETQDRYIELLEKEYGRVLFPKLTYNKWSAYDFMTLFLSYRKLSIVMFEPFVSARDLYFARQYKHLLAGYSESELVTSGFRVVFKK